MTRKRTVLFVCNHNAGRSQMAEAYLRAAAGDRFEAKSAGSNPSDSLNPVVVEAMAEDGIAIASSQPKRLDAAMLATADYIVTMGCKDGCVTRNDEDWALPDPHGQPLERVREIRDLVKQRIAALVERMSSAEVPPVKH